MLTLKLEFSLKYETIEVHLCKKIMNNEVYIFLRVP